MRQENHSESANENGGKAASRENLKLRSRLDIYRWLLWAAVFLIVVLVVAQCAHHLP